MTISNYGELKSTIADMLNRDDLTAAIPTFIRLGEAEVNRRLRHWRMERRATALFNEPLELLPNDWLETIRLELDGQGPLRLVSQMDMATLKANDAEAGHPRFFTHSAGMLEFWPEPNAETGTGRLIYFAKSPVMVADTDTNWTLLEAPDLYLYAALIHTAPYLQDDARLAVWKGLFEEVLRAMNAESDAARFSGPLVMRLRNG
jgi:hypothetical protein